MGMAERERNRGPSGSSKLLTHPARRAQTEPAQIRDCVLRVEAVSCLGGCPPQPGDCRSYRQDLRIGLGLDRLCGLT
jgi:hypothetical protein